MSKKTKQLIDTSRMYSQAKKDWEDFSATIHS